MAWSVSGRESTFRRSAPGWGTQLTGRAPGVRFFGPADRSDRLAPIKLISTPVHNATCDVHVQSPGQGTARWCSPGDGRADGGAAGDERGRAGSGRVGTARPSARTPR